MAKWQDIVQDDDINLKPSLEMLAVQTPPPPFFFLSLSLSSLLLFPFQGLQQELSCSLGGGGRECVSSHATRYTRHYHTYTHTPCTLQTHALSHTAHTYTRTYHTHYRTLSHTHCTLHTHTHMYVCMCV